MRSSWSSAFTLFAIIIVATGCAAQPRARVVRLLPSADRTEWSVSVNGAPKHQVVLSTQLTNQLALLRLQHGDMVIFGKLPWATPNQPDEAGSRLVRYFDSLGVMVYYFTGTRKASVFSVPAYHWVAPFDNPRDLANAAFFREGKFLGTGMDGFKEMLGKIALNHEPNIFILGSLYDINRGFGNHEVPYENQEQLLRDVLKKCDTELLFPSELPGF